MRRLTVLFTILCFAVAGNAAVRAVAISPVGHDKAIDVVAYDLHTTTAATKDTIAASGENVYLIPLANSPQYPMAKCLTACWGPITGSGTPRIGYQVIKSTTMTDTLKGAWTWFDTLTTSALPCANVDLSGVAGNAIVIKVAEYGTSQQCEIHNGLRIMMKANLSYQAKR